MISLLHGKEWAIKLDKKYFLICYLKDKYKVMVVFCGLIVCNVFMYFLYDVRMEPILYTTFLLILLVTDLLFSGLSHLTIGRRTLQRSVCRFFHFGGDHP